jgi:hypothetical protein
VCFYVGLAAGYCARGASQVQRLQGVFIGEKPTEPGAYTGQPVAQVLEHGEQVDGLDCRGAGSVADAHPLVAPEGPWGSSVWSPRPRPPAGRQLRNTFCADTFCRNGVRDRRVSCPCSDVRSLRGVVEVDVD